MIERTRHSRAESLSARFLLGWLAALLAGCGACEPSFTYNEGRVYADCWKGPEPKDGWQSALIVRTGATADAPPMLGDYRESGGVITFTPRFEPTPGVPLYVTYNHAERGPMSGLVANPAKALSPSARVTHIYPSTDEWPANTLKMYVTFSAPMASGDAYTHISIHDDQGRVVEGPFVEIEPELWDPTGTRLTLLFDPGRIKRGLVDNEQSGPPLMPGRTVTIEVDPAMRDARGAPLAEKLTRTIHIVDAVREPVDVKTWRVEAPKSASDDLVITFPRPLDHALAQRAISISREGARIAGWVALEDNETRFRFTPDAEWKSGAHEIFVDGVIEDLAGNRLGKVFDVDTSDPDQSTSATASATITFDVLAR
jgi:hypothetical protein